MLARFRGVLFGGAIGDALGYPVEFDGSAASIRQRLGTPSLERFPFAAPAKVSDDTQMTLFVAEGLIRERTIGMQAHAMLRWLATQGEQAPKELLDGWLLDVRELHARRAPGNTCLASLRAIARDPKTLPTIENVLNDSKGCGAVMRSAPIGLVSRDRESAFVFARDAGVLTHGHPSGYLSAAYFASLIFDLVRDVSLEHAMDHADVLLSRERGREEMQAILARVRASRNAEVRTIESLGGGWTGEEALAIALACVIHDRDIASALHRAVAHGGDSDSTGSIAGNLLGAMHGVEALPRAWLDAIELRDVIERLARELYEIQNGDGAQPK